MPLSCDCFPGCWGEHSLGWPEVERPETMGVDEFHRRIRSTVSYGSYVMVGEVVRIETADQAVIAQLTLSE